MGDPESKDGSNLINGIMLLLLKKTNTLVYYYRYTIQYTKLIHKYLKLLN